MISESLSPNLRGALLLTLAAAGFSGVAVLVKLLGDSIPVVQIVMMRQLIITLLLWPAFRRDGLAILRTERPALHSFRVCGALVAMLLGFGAVVNLPLADATAIGFAKAVFLTLFAVLILRERVGVYRWGAVAVGFAGVIVMLQPGAIGVSFWSLTALGAAALLGLVLAVVRLLALHDGTRTLMAWQALGVGLAVLPFGLWFWVWPSPTQWLLLLSLGGLSFLSQRLNIDAYRSGEASLLASLDYIRLLYAVLLGYLFFDQLPTWQTALGAGLIVLAALVTVYREHRLNRAVLRAATRDGQAG